MKHPHGVVPILPTIFHADGSIDERGFVATIRYVLEAGAHGVAFPALASEFYALTDAERLRLTDVLVQEVGGAVSVVGTATAPSPTHAIDLARQVSALGVDALMVMPPYVVRDGPAATIDLFRGMASVTNLPLIVQNAPPPLGSGFGSDFVVRLLEAVPEITYLKEENTPGGQRISQVRAKAPATLKGIFGGAGGRYLMDELHRGAIGVMPACEITEIHVRIHDAFARGETALARSLYDRTLPLLTFQAVFRMNMTKEVLVRRGLIAHPHVRVGAVPLDARDQEELDALLHDLADLTIGLPR